MQISMTTKPRRGQKKGDNGRLLVVAGSRDLAGAAYLCTASAIAAMRMGIDLVTVVAPSRVAWAINSMNPDIMTVKVQGAFFSDKNLGRVRALAKNNDALLIGPGIGRNRLTGSFVRKLMGVDMPKIADADAIKMLDLRKIRNTLLTPHMGELRILMKNSGLEMSGIKSAARDLKKIIGDNALLVKSSTDTIISAGKVAKNRTGNPGMTVGGTGDVLAGIAAGLVAQGHTLYGAACKAADVNGRIGDKLKKKYGDGFIASDFLGEIARYLH